MSRANRGRALPLHREKYSSMMRQYRLLLILPLILGAVLLLCVNAVISRQIEQAGKISAERFEAQASGILREMKIVSDSLLKDRIFLQDINADSIEDFDPTELSAIIRDHVRESPFVSDVFVVSNQHRHIYSDLSYFIYPSSPKLLSDVVGSTYDIELNTEVGWHVLNANYAPPHYVAAIPAEDGSGVAAILITTLNMREFLRTLQQDDAALCCIFNDSFSFSSLLTNYPDMDWRSPDAVNQLLGTPVRCFYSEQEDFTYLTAISTRSYYAPLFTVIFVFCAYFVLLVVFSLIYIRIVSARRYRNILALIDGLPQATGADPTYEGMLKTIRDSLTDYRQREKADREQALLQRLLLGSYAASIPATELSAVGFTEGTAGYYAALFHLRDSSGIVEGSSPSVNADMTCMMLEAGLNRFAADGIHASVAQIDRDYCAVLSLTDPEITSESIKTAVRDTVQLIEQEYGFDLCAAVSTRVRTPEELRSAYQEAYRLFGFRRAIGSEADVLIQEDVATDSGSILNGDFMNHLQMLTNTLQMEKYDYIPAMVSTLLEEHVAVSLPHYSRAQNRLNTISSILADAVLSSSFPEDFKVAAAEKLQSSTSIAQLNAAALDVFGYMSRNTQSAASEELLQRVFAYIDENLDDPSLSVPAVCEAVGETIHHLLHLFRQRLNMTLVEYINVCRVERSKPLLLEKNATVADVALAVGYNNSVTFTRNFRRHVGMPPSEYRNLNL